MASEARSCYECGEHHLKNIFFFSYWGQCKECGTYLCPDHSGLSNSRITQYMALVYVLVTMIFYLGIFLIIAPIKDPTFALRYAYAGAALILLIPFFFLLIGIRSAARRLSQQPEAVHNCPKCNGQMSIIYHDIFLYFWIFFLPLLYISTIANEIGIFFYLIYGSGGYALSIGFVVNLVVIVLLIILIFRWIGGKFLQGYKMHIRVWFGEIFAIFLMITLNIIFLSIIPTDDFTFSFHLIYYITSVVAWYFPAFLIGSIIYKVAQKWFNNINKSYLFHVLIAISFIVLSFFLWGFLDYTFNIYVPTDSSSHLPYYSTVFNEIVPLILISLLIGLGLISLYRRILSKSSSLKINFILRILVILGISFFVFFIAFDLIFYLLNGTLLLDSISSLYTPVFLGFFLACCLIILLYEIYSNWGSSLTAWGKMLETRLGSLIYPTILCFLLIAATLGFSSLVIITASTTIELMHPLNTNVFNLKLIFVVGFVAGLIIGILKKN